MNEEEGIARLLRSALPPVDDHAPDRDLGSLIAHRRTARPSRPWIELGVAVAVALALSLMPGSLWLLLYHL